MTKKVHNSFPDVFKQAGIEGKILHIFRPAWLGEGPRRAIRASVRVATEDQDEILAKSGSGGLLLKEFETEYVAGGVRWIRKLDDESGADCLCRAFRLPELQTPQKGLAFASSGSPGLRNQAGQVPSMWRVEGFLWYVAAEDAVRILSASGWKDVETLSKRSRRESASWIIRGRKDTPGCQSYDVPVEGSDELCHVEVSPFRPAQRTLNVVHAKDRVQTFDKKVEPPMKAIGVRQRPVVNRLTSPQRKKRNQQTVQAVGVGTKADELFASFMTSLGLTRHEALGDGDCLFHALGHLLKAAKKDIFAAGALREVACNMLEANVEGYHTVWDGKYPDNSPSPTWASYVQNMRKQGQHAGELEILALSKAVNLTVYVVRPGLPTLQIGKGRAAVWVKLERRHCEPIVTSADVATVANRRQHCKEIHKAYKWTTVITMKAAGHLTGNEGRGGARSSE